MSDPYILQAIYEIKSNPDNCFCFECSTPNPSFSSVNNGCLICSNCVLTHNSLGSSISSVKELTANLTQSDANLVLSGGNSALKQFFDFYNISNTPANFKYQTKASFYYREMLLNVSQNIEFNKEVPSIEEGIQIIHQEEEKKSAWGWAKKAYLKTVEFGNKTVEKVNEKINKTEESSRVKSFEGKAAEFLKKIESGMKKFSEKEKVQEYKEKTVKMVEKVRDKFRKHEKK